MRLPTVWNRLKSRTRFVYNKESKKQQKKQSWKVTASRRKPLSLSVVGTKEERHKWRQWQKERPARPKTGTIQLRTDKDAIFTLKFTNLYPNRVHEEKDMLDVDLTFDTMDIEKNSPDT